MRSHPVRKEGAGAHPSRILGKEPPDEEEEEDAGSGSYSQRLIPSIHDEEHQNSQ